MLDPAVELGPRLPAWVWTALSVVNVGVLVWLAATGGPTLLGVVVLVLVAVTSEASIVAAQGPERYQADLEEGSA